MFIVPMIKLEPLTVGELADRVIEIKHVAAGNDLAAADEMREYTFWLFARQYIATHDDDYATLLGMIE